MKVIFITREGYRLPGARIRCYYFADALRKYGLEVEVLSFADSFGAQDGEDERKENLFKRMKYNFMAFNRLLKEHSSIFIMQRFNYHSFGPYLARILSRNKLILDLDDWEIREDPEYHFGFWPTSKAEFFTRYVAQNSNACIAASRLLYRYLSDFNRNVHYLPSGVDHNAFKPRANLSDNKKIVFSWIGSIHNKDVLGSLQFSIDCFMRVRQKYPQARFEILGYGAFVSQLKEALEHKNTDAVIFKGYVSPKQIPNYLADIDIGLLPLMQNTQFNNAKSPVKLFEYMSCGKPTVSSRIGEATQIIKDGENGLLASDKEEFISKMEILADSRQMRENIGLSARKTIEEKYSLEILGQRLCRIVGSV